jgi:SulP family sulfate permease
VTRLFRFFHAFPIASALRHSLHGGYGREAFLADLGAGLSVGIIAVPLAMALAIASGVPPQHGLYTAAFAGMLTALLGGSRYSVSGPTAAFVVILHPIAARHGLGGLLTATLLAGAILTVMGMARMGALIKYIPFPVTMGFTAGIAVVIASLQVKDLLGLEMEQPERFGARLVEVGGALATINPSDAAIGALALGLVFMWPRLKVPHLPAPLVAAVAATLAALAYAHWDPAHAPATIASRFHHLDTAGLLHGGIPEDLPGLAWPWDQAIGDSVSRGLSLDLLRELLGPALAIALLAAIESLLCAVVVDSMTNTRHNADGELIGLGLANMVVPFVGGIAATGAIARSAANVRYGARTPIAAALHGLFVLLVLVSLGTVLDLLPMAALAALLLAVAWNMGEFDRIRHVLRFAPRSDIAVLMTCFLLTVFVDMVFAVGVGVVLAALLFMRRMAALVETQAVTRGGTGGKRAGDKVIVPEHTVLFHISGPLFFGAADKAASVIDLADPGVRAVILDLSAVPMMDASGAVALESAVTRLRQHKVLTILAGVNGQPRKVLERVGLKGARHELRITRSLEQALRIAATAEPRRR